MPQNGAGEAPGAPAASPPASAGAPAAAPPAVDHAALRAKAEKDLSEATARLQKMEADAKDFAKDRERLKSLDALEQDRTRNPVKHLQRLLGEDWKAGAAKLAAGTVAPEHVSAALDEREKSIRSYVDETVKTLKEENARLRADADERLREKHAGKASAYVKENAAKYALLDRYKQGDSLGAFIEGHHSMTGELWSMEQGAAELEKYWTNVREMVLRGENGRVLGDMPGTAPSPLMGRPPEPKADETDAERQARKQRASQAWAAWAKPQGQRAN